MKRSRVQPSEPEGSTVDRVLERIVPGPHLHFQVTTCPDRDECGTEPITFSNTSANPSGLLVGKSYRAKN